MSDEYNRKLQNESVFIRFICSIRVPLSIFSSGLSGLGLAIKVHRELGPGLFESVYQAALAYELQQAGISFEKEKVLDVHYQDIILDVGFRCNFLIDDQVIVECKAVRQLPEIDNAQIINYLKLAHKPVGLLINFNVGLT